MSTSKPYQVRRLLSDRVDALAPGQSLPSERSLALELAVSRSTVRQAITDLVAAGRVRRVHGSGTYAVEPKVQLPIRLASYTRDVSDQGLRPTSRIVSLTKDVAGEAVAYALGIREGAKVWRLERVRRTDATPLAFECAYLPVDRFPNLKRLLRDDDSLYEIVQREYTCTPSRAVQSIETAMAEPEHYELLEADNSMPMLMLVRTTYDQAGVAFEHVLSVFRGDRCRLVSVLLPQP